MIIIVKGEAALAFSPAFVSLEVAYEQVGMYPGVFLDKAPE